jgi:hypothetical protein
MSKTLRVTCPDCGAMLEVDSQSGALLDHRSRNRRRADIDLSQAAQTLEQQARERDSRFERSVEAQKRQEEVLGRKFREGLDKARSEPVEPPPPRDVDLD